MSSASQQPDNEYDPVELLYFIDRHYSLDGVRTLCFELGVDYENLPGEGKKGKARELILSEMRRRGLVALAKLLQRDHPQAFSREITVPVPATAASSPKPVQTLSTREQTAIQAAVRAVAVALGGEGQSPQWNRVYADLRRAFGVSSYRDIPAERFDDAIWFLSDWLAELEATP